ncbi:MAG: putative porin [Candidatus Omnitrophica bacterium]|nr:putative porin [Candidatus Omnitrophota bacterium]
MYKLARLFFAAFVVIFCFYSSQVFAGEVDILVKKLVEKGILTNGEAQQILTETKEEVRKEIAKGTYSSLPSWLQNIKLKGDMRVRYQWEDKTSAEDQHRGRIRFRLGAEAKVNDKLKVFAGLATGGDDPRSTNQTLNNTFDTGDIRLDYAMGEWAAAPWATFRAGKLMGIKDQIMRPTDLLWDSDINPEGASILFNKQVWDNVGLFMNNGVWILDESSGEENDPYMVVVQPGFKVGLGDLGFIGSPTLKMATAWYAIANERGITLDWSARTNSLDANGDLLYNYDAVSPSLQLDIDNPLGAVVPYASISVEGIHNPDPNDDNNGWAAGIKFGDKKIADFGNWQLAYVYKRLERDAWLDTFPDSDAYSGGTNIKGHEAILSYGIGKNTSIDIDWYTMERIKGNGRRNVFQVDWNLKF